MIKKLKIGFLIAVLSLAVGASSANAAALTWSANQSVYLTTPGYTMTIVSGSEATSVVVNAASVDVIIPTSSVFTMTSRNNVDLTNNSGTATTTNTCSGTLNTITITSTSTANYTLTPNGGVCAGNSGGGGGGGGGGYTYTPPPVTPPVVPPVTPATPADPAVKEIPGCGNRTTGFSVVDGASCALNKPATPASPATPPTAGAKTSFNFGTKTLKNGSRGEAAKELQRFLNQVLNLGLVVDGIIGPKSIAVIKTWQKANGLAADGLIGPLTKAKMNASVKP